ncbi:MAG: PIG-L family deacetylase [Spirochaetaceae bacterium]|nr:MAG: PIG-L family deacetylase [Spirochaetaceae bacterium]
MSARGKMVSPSSLLLLCVLLGLLVLGPAGSLFAQEAFDRPDVDAETAVMDNLRRGVLISVSWILLFVGFALVALTLRKTYIWLMALHKARVPPTRYFNLQLQVRDQSGDLSLHNFDYYPVVVAAGGSADLVLPAVTDADDCFRIDYRHGQAQLSSPSFVIVNGVPRQHKPLKQDDRIIFGPYRLVFKDASIREQPAPIPGKPVFAWQFPIVALLLALSVLFKQAGAVPDDTMLLAKAAELQGAGQGAGNVVDAEASVERPAEGVEEEDAPNRIPLIQRLRWMFFAWQTEAIRVAEAREPIPADSTLATPERTQATASVQSAVTPEISVPKPAASRSAIQERRPAEAVLAESALPEASSQRQKPQQQASQSPQSAVAAMRQSVPTQVNSRADGTPRRTEAVASTTLPPSVATPPASIARLFSPSRQAPTTPQPLPDRKPVVTADPPIETVAEVPAPGFVDGSAPREQATPLPQQRASQQPPVLQASVLASVVPAAVQNDGINPLEGLGFSKTRSVPEIGRTKVRVIPPGRPVEFFKADILFIHAHPDDESIDFGSLMARASRSNKRIVTLLFTDGESGLDLYPQRKVGDIYPARSLNGGALSQVRVVEATRALSILGSEMYLRWGLDNRPYNTKRDEISPDEVILGWGGEEQLVDRLIDVLEGFQPAIVVSPDRHSKAYEHFEHEAVGQLVRNALERLRSSGRPVVNGHLVSVDPYQVERYTDVVALDAQIRDSQSGLSYRAIQALALKEHVTQGDASVIAVSRLSPLPQEFYKILYWNHEESIEEYLR